MSLRDTLEHLLSGNSLSENEAGELLRAIVGSEMAGGEMSPALAGAFLAALRSKGVTADEVRGFARAMRALALTPAIPQGSRAIDIVGTGGDSSGSFNLSTGAALLTAACGVDVIKHGNRSVSSKSGSADVLEHLGLKLPLDASAAGACLAATRFTFLFAPHYHPAMKAVGPIRKDLGVRTVFNILGPLTNPAAPLFQLTGAFNLPTAQLMAEALSGLPIERAFVVHGAEGWDEPTPLGPFTVLDVRPGEVKASIRSPSDYGLDLCGTRDLAGSDAATNAMALRAVLEGAERGAHRDALLLGAALALEIVGRVDQPRDGVALAKEAIDSGAARAILAKLRAFGMGVGV
jgi:anthranilate phosphoribosyltransferase